MSYNPRDAVNGIGATDHSQEQQGHLRLPCSFISCTVVGFLMKGLTGLLLGVVGVAVTAVARHQCALQKARERRFGIADDSLMSVQHWERDTPS